MLKQESKLKIFWGLLSLSFLALSCSEFTRLDEKGLTKKREIFMKTSMNIIGEQNYWSVYNQINDSINNWKKQKLEWYDEDSTKSQYQIDSLLCFNAQGDKMITTRMARGLEDNSTMDAVLYYYGVKIERKWYFFSGPIMHVPRKYYQKDIHTPLSFEKLKLIATSNMYSGYLKKNLWGKWEINEGFFSDLTSQAWCSDCVTQEDWNKRYLSIIRRKWSKKETTL